MVDRIRVSALKTYYFTHHGVVKAVDNVNLKIREKEMLGLAGESGCGKTTLGSSLIRLLRPPGRIVDGEIFLDGEDIVGKNKKDMRTIRWKKISMIFQSAMNALNPLLKVKDQIAEAILTHDTLDRAEITARIRELFEKVGIEASRMNDYPHQFSGGMKQRVVIAMALACSPEVVIADEPTTGLDVISQSQILKLLKDIQREMNLSVLLITHNLSIIAETCENLAIMYAGKIVEYADVHTMVEKPMHPYSQGIIESFPSLLHARGERMKFIPGVPPDLIDLPDGCRFHPRCPYASDVCRRSEPSMVEIEKGHQVACHLMNPPQ